MCAILAGIMNHDKLERYSFLWSEVRLLIAAVSLFIGGVSPLLYVAINAQGLFALATLILKVAWLVSGIASAYLLYQWAQRKTLFGKKDILDGAAFAVSVVSGLNLGLTGVVGQNIGLTLSQNYIVLVVTAFVYLASAVYLYRRWGANGQRLFS